MNSLYSTLSIKAHYSPTAALLAPIIRWRSLLSVAALVAVISGTSSAQESTNPAPETVQFNRDIRPLLFDNCFACHGPDANTRAADLRLDDRQWAIESGAITPGKPEESELIARLSTDDEDLVMPPPKSHKTLTEAQKRMLIEWVKSGAEYQPHWSFIAPQPVSIPKVQKPSWVRNPIDSFVLARLEAEKLQQAP